MNIAILGFGTVGQGVYRTLNKNRELFKKEYQVKYILTKNSKPEVPGVFVVHDFKNIIEDQYIDIIVEVMGGINPAYSYIKAALKSGRHVISANKDLMALHGPELFQLAQSNQVSLLFDASVMGGVPAFALLQSLERSNQVQEIKGILNGTCNYILTRMDMEKLSFEAALKQAQVLGYAEASPKADIQGTDSARKLVLLASFISKQAVSLKDLTCKGIDCVDAIDFEYANALSAKIKLVATSVFKENEVHLSVYPTLVSSESVLAQVHDADNALSVIGNIVGEIAVIGPGAGSMETASAIVSDLESLGRERTTYFQKKANLKVSSYLPDYVFVRTSREVTYNNGTMVDLGVENECGWIIPYSELKENQVFLSMDESVIIC